MMRSWIAEKLFDLAVWLDWDAAVIRSFAVLIVEAKARARIAPKKKIGRPLGSKNKPKVTP